MLRLTLDANVLHALLDPRREFHAAAVRLFELAEQGRVRLAVTSRVRGDIPREPLRSRVAALPLVTLAQDEGSGDAGALVQPGPPAPTGAGRSKGRAKRRPTPSASERAARRAAEAAQPALHERLMALLFPLATRAGARHAGRLSDVDHLVSHLRSGGDYFVSDDKALHGRAPQLAKEGIRVIGLARAVQLAELDGS